MIHDMLTAGFFLAVQEIMSILREEDQDERLSKREGKKTKRLIKRSILADRLKVELIADTLCFCQKETELGKATIQAIDTLTLKHLSNFYFLHREARCHNEETEGTWRVIHEGG
jgi:hypothetical protein